jgi:diguanylate cyclase (GGDEF)-like protein
VRRPLPFLLADDILRKAPSATGRAGMKVASRRQQLVPLPSRTEASERRRAKAEESLEEALSSAVLAQNKELAGIIHEVDDLLKKLKSDTSDPKAVSSTLQRTVLCAAKQSLIEQELKALALTDDLTCLYNRRAFLALGTQQVKLMRRRRQGLLLFFADVDNLKRINDSFGHLEGDYALVRAANALEQTFRDSDIVARLGGDEFAILAPEASGEDQEAILSRLEERLRRESAGESRYRLSLSMGVVRLDPRHYVSIGELMRQADAAMYQEKARKKTQRKAGEPPLRSIFPGTGERF